MPYKFLYLRKYNRKHQYFFYIRLSQIDKRNECIIYGSFNMKQENGKRNIILDIFVIQNDKNHRFIQYNHCYYKKIDFCVTKYTELGNKFVRDSKVSKAYT